MPRKNALLTMPLTQNREVLSLGEEDHLPRQRKRPEEVVGKGQVPLATIAGPSQGKFSVPSAHGRKTILRIGPKITFTSP